MFGGSASALNRFFDGTGRIGRMNGYAPFEGCDSFPNRVSYALIFHHPLVTKNSRKCPEIMDSVMAIWLPLLTMTQAAVPRSTRAAGSGGAWSPPTLDLQRTLSPGPLGLFNAARGPSGAGPQVPHSFCGQRDAGPNLDLDGMIEAAENLPHALNRVWRVWIDHRVQFFDDSRRKRDDFRATDSPSRTIINRRSTRTAGSGELASFPYVKAVLTLS